MQETIRTLRLFNEKVTKLKSLRFTKAILNVDFGYRISAKQGQNVIFRRYGPDDESVDAFVLTYRFFIQNNEPTSFQRMEELYRNLPLDTPWKQGAIRTHQTLDQFLDSNTPVVFRTHQINRRERHDVFLKGGLAHANKTKKDQFDEWASRPDMFLIRQAEFVKTLVGSLECVFWFHDANVAALKLL
tara:strand:- start:87 stop:647 length:561 start_codon:yes stop_codon:yes gene_type:complete